MSCSFGNKVKIQVFGQSHSQMIGVVIDGLPAGFELDLEAVYQFLMRRQGGKAVYTTPRKEEDRPIIISGLIDGKTCGAPLTAVFENKNIQSKDYREIADVPRPSHADYVAHVKYNGANDVRGGGHFSGRMTLPICFAGAVCMQMLEQKGISIDSHIYSIGNVKDSKYNAVSFEKIQYLHDTLPVFDKEKGDEMENLMVNCAEKGDSIGGQIECRVIGLPVGVGEPMFDGLENTIASAVFAIPAVKGIEFGAGFASSEMLGSEHNDPFKYNEDENVITTTNNSGGILGGISTGMPVVFNVAIKPTPSISIEQKSIRLSTKKDDILSVRGRHDPCIVPRAVPCIEAITALAIINII